MSILGRFTKQPAEKESYSINYVYDLIDSDALATVVTLIEPSGLTLEYAIVVDKRAKIFVSGGTKDTRYKITVTTTTDDGRVFQDEFYVTIKDY